MKKKNSKRARLVFLFLVGLFAVATLVVWMIGMVVSIEEFRALSLSKRDLVAPANLVRLEDSFAVFHPFDYDQVIRFDPAEKDPQTALIFFEDWNTGRKIRTLELDVYFEDEGLFEEITGISTSRTTTDEGEETGGFCVNLWEQDTQSPSLYLYFTKDEKLAQWTYSTSSGEWKSKAGIVFFQETE